MKKKLEVPDLPTDPTDGEREAFRVIVTDAIEDFPQLTPQQQNRILSSVLLKLAGIVPSTLPEGVTTEPIDLRSINKLSKRLKRKIIVRVTR
jgi:hypothetical protein